MSHLSPCMVRMRRLAGAAAALVAVAVSPLLAADRYEAQRAEMLRVIEAHRAALARQLEGDKMDSRVLAAMAAVPRHEFVPERQRANAYDDRPLPIGQGQTISQPFIVALMSDLLQVEPDAVVLEVGTGSGYQAAVLAHLARRVYTIEIVAPLAEQAKARLARLGYDTVEVRMGDGYQGWAEAGPFDGIMVTAAADHVPPQLIEQLKPGGRLVMPVGGSPGIQYLTLIEIGQDGQVKTNRLLPVRFVPLTGGR